METYKIVLIAIALVLVALVVYFLYCRKRNRDHFLEKLHENQVCRLRIGEEDSAIVRVVSLYTDYAWVVDQKTLKESKVPIVSLYPL